MLSAYIAIKTNQLLENAPLFIQFLHDAVTKADCFSAGEKKLYFFFFLVRLKDKNY